MTVSVDLLIAFALVLANGFFVASEFALARLRTTQVADLERDRRPGSRSLRHALAHLDADLVACQLGITIASIAVAGTVVFGLITVLHAVIGELAPKSFAISRTTDAGLRVAPTMRVFYSPPSRWSICSTGSAI